MIPPFPEDAPDNGRPHGGCQSAEFAALDETMQYKQEGEKLLLVIKSTVPPGTVENRVLPYLEAQGWKNGVDFSLASALVSLGRQ